MSTPETPDTNRFELVFEASGTVGQGTAPHAPGEEPDDEGEIP